MSVKSNRNEKAEDTLLARGRMKPITRVGARFSRDCKGLGANEAGNAHEGCQIPHSPSWEGDRSYHSPWHDIWLSQPLGVVYIKAAMGDYLYRTFCHVYLARPARWEWYICK